MRTRYEVVIITIYANWYIFWQMFQFITFHLNAQIFEINIRYLQLLDEGIGSYLFCIDRPSANPRHTFTVHVQDLLAKDRWRNQIQRHLLYSIYVTVNRVEVHCL